MTLSSKKTFLTIGALLLVAATAYFVIQRQPIKNQTNTPPSESNTTLDSNDPNFLLNQIIGTTKSADGTEFKTIKNRSCGITFSIPSNWSIEGYLGESKIISPKDKQLNEEWDRDQQELIQKEEGDAPLGPDARSLYISCQYGTSGFLNNFSTSKYYQQFANAQSLPEAFATNAFHAEDSDVLLKKTIEIDGGKAYEIAWTVNRPAGLGPITNYMIVLGQEKVLEIHLSQTKYDDLSNQVKQIIQSITFKE